MKNWLLWLVIGIISIIGGIICLANPLQASITAEKLAGWFFVFIGVLQVITAWRAKGFSAKLWAGIAGAAGLFVGVSLLQNPLAGIISLTIIIAVLFLFTGLAKLFISFSLRNTKSFMPVLLSGVISIVLSLMVFFNLPMAAVTVLGVLLAIELISNGISLIMLALKLKSDNQNGSIKSVG